MFHIFYSTTTGEITHTCWEGDLYRRGAVPDTMVGKGKIVIDDDVLANRAKIYMLLRSLATPTRPRPGGPRPPRGWQVRLTPAPPVLLNSAGNVVTFDRNPERESLFAALPSGPGMVNRLEQIRDNVVGLNLAQTQAALRDLAIINLRLLRVLRQVKAGEPGD